MFNEFLDETTPVPTMINVDDVKTVDLAGFDKEEDDFPIYDTEIVPQPTPSPVSRTAIYPQTLPPKSEIYQCDTGRDLGLVSLEGG